MTSGSLSVAVVTARAVAPLDRLAGWPLPHARVGGVLLALLVRVSDQSDRRAPAPVVAQ